MRSLIIILLVACCQSVFAQTILTARINNVKDGVGYLWNTEGTRVDTVLIRNNAFSYSSDSESPSLFYLKIEKYNEFDLPIRLILSGEKTVLVIDTLKAAKRGSKWSEIYPNKSTFSSDPNNNSLLQKLEMDWITFSDRITELTPDGSTEDQLLEKRKTLYLNFISNFEQTISNNSHSVASAVALYEYLIRNQLIDLKKTIEFYNRLSTTVRNSTTGIKIGTHINREAGLAIGSKAPDFAFKDLQGNNYTLASLQNKNILLHFWSSSCGPCRVENRSVVELYKWSNANVTIVNISLDADKDAWTKAIAKDGMEGMMHTSDLTGMDNKIAKDYSIHGVPSYYLIGMDGTILAKGSLSEIRERIE